MSRRIVVLTAALLVPSLVAAQGSASDTTLKVTFGGFVDGYYAFDFNRPANFDRSFTTQPARHNEFNVNLAYVEAKLDAPRVRGRLALQAGTSVQSNYSAEPRNGGVSGADLARHLQEAYAGVKVGDNVWVDGGIFFSHIGVESFISRDNLAYTRSTPAEFTPYYVSGARLVWQATPTVSATVAVINGWQNISETNSGKAAGVRIDYAPSAATTFSFYNYLGDEGADSARNSQVRFFNGVGFKSSLTQELTVLVELDYGVQQRASGSGNANWYGGTLTGRYQVTPTAALNGRVERFDDRDQVLIATGLAQGFRANGASIGLDVAPQPRVLWRTEFRGLQGENAVFPKKTGGPSRSDAFVVTSLALTF